tara:strand:- start:1280 stop:1546 length:267 start_codon:yes stop_codon:yes gene_type:complete
LAASKANIGIDGIQRTANQDKVISTTVAHLFESEAGKAVMEYLKSITINRVHGPNISTEELRHHEGQRYIVGLLQARTQHGHKVKQDV